MPKQSEVLTKFYKAYQTWQREGAIHNYKQEFYRDGGLCSTLRRFCVLDLGMNYSNACNYVDELKHQFKDAGLDDCYPFGEEDYIKRTYQQTMHTCPKRMKWVNDHAQ